MGVSSSANRIVRPSGARTSNFNQSNGLRANAIFSNIFGKPCAAGRNGVASKTAVSERQQGMLARLVGIVEPQVTSPTLGGVGCWETSVVKVFTAPFKAAQRLLVGCGARP